MIRVKISGFIKNNINKIRDVGTKLIIVAMVVLVATIMLSSSSNNSEVEKDNINVYKPTETIIKGSDVSAEQYETDSNTVDKFLDFCNQDQLEGAYNLLTEECKATLYPTIEDFKEYYKNIIFKEEKEYNLQAWISTSKYTVYKIRYTNNLLETGKYEEEDIYQDYITLNKETGTISIGNHIYSEECNIVTKTEQIQAIVVKKDIYISYEEYEINIKNNSEKTILLDNLEKGITIRLIGGRNIYTADSNKLFLSNLTIQPGETKRITIKFKKFLSASDSSDRIEFVKVINDYEEYKQDKENYNNTSTIKIKLED